MNRRESIKAALTGAIVAAMPDVASADEFVGDAKFLRLEQNDALVITCENFIRREDKAKIIEAARNVVGDRKVLVLDGGLGLEVLRQ